MAATPPDLAMEFYPPKYWGLDPIYHACVKLSIADVLNLTEHPTCKGTYARIVQCATAPTFTVDAVSYKAVFVFPRPNGTHIRANLDSTNH